MPVGLPWGPGREGHARWAAVGQGVQGARCRRRQLRVADGCRPTRRPACIHSALLPSLPTHSLAVDAARSKPEVSDAALSDLCAVRERDPACLSYSQALLHFKGFHAIQASGRFVHLDA